jgi:hypothetical protein
MTRKGRYGAEPFRHRRLTAILKVVEVFESHAAAAKWYCARGLDLPSNCMVPGNPAFPLDQSHRDFDSRNCAGDWRTHSAWEREYRSRKNAYGTFVVCKVLFRDLSWQAPVVEDKHLRFAFGRIPGTQNPGALSLQELNRFVRALSVRVSLPGGASGSED